MLTLLLSLAIANAAPKCLTVGEVRAIECQAKCVALKADAGFVLKGKCYCGYVFVDETKEVKLGPRLPGHSYDRFEVP